MELVGDSLTEATEDASNVHARLNQESFREVIDKLKLLVLS